MLASIDPIKLILLASIMSAFVTSVAMLVDKANKRNDDTNTS